MDKLGDGWVAELVEGCMVAKLVARPLATRGTLSSNSDIKNNKLVA